MPVPMYSNLKQKRWQFMSDLNSFRRYYGLFYLTEPGLFKGKCTTTPFLIDCRP